MFFIFIYTIFAKLPLIFLQRLVILGEWTLQFSCTNLKTSDSDNPAITRNVEFKMTK